MMADLNRVVWKDEHSSITIDNKTIPVVAEWDTKSNTFIFTSDNTRFILSKEDVDFMNVLSKRWSYEFTDVIVITSDNHIIKLDGSVAVVCSFKDNVITMSSNASSREIEFYAKVLPREVMVVERIEEQNNDT